MSQAITERSRSVRGDPSQGKTALRVVPIVGPSAREPEYRLLEGDVLAKVRVTETSPSGSVPELRIDNALDTRVFLMDGQELLGAKQNRILNTDVLVPAKCQQTVPVSCVEAGRWSYATETFSPGKSASYAIRSAKSERVRSSLRDAGTHDADQGAVWDEVRYSLVRSGSSSPTSALSDAYQQRRRDLTELRASLSLPEHTVGIAVFHGERLLGLDLFDRHYTLRYFWESLVDSYAIDWLVEPTEPPGRDADNSSVVQQVLERAAAGRWEAFPTPGEGRDYRLEDAHLTGSALVWEERTVLHLQLFPKAQTQAPEPGRQTRPRVHRPYRRPDTRPE